MTAHVVPIKDKHKRLPNTDADQALSTQPVEPVRNSLQLKHGCKTHTSWPFSSGGRCCGKVSTCKDGGNITHLSIHLWAGLWKEGWPLCPFLPRTHGARVATLNCELAFGFVFSSLPGFCKVPFLCQCSTFRVASPMVCNGKPSQKISFNR